MKIALLNDQLNAGGAEKVLVNMANLLHQKGVQVIVVLFMSPTSLDAQLHPSIPVHYLHRKSKWHLGAMLALRKLVHDCDIVHIHSRYNLRYFMVARYLTGIFTCKVVFHEHLPGYESLDRFTRFLLRQVDAYIAVLQPICTWAANNNIVRREKIFFLPNVVNSPAVAISRDQFTPKKILLTANFRAVKNHRFAIEIMRALGNGYTLDLLGTIEEHQYFLQLQSFIQQKDLGHRVRIIQGVTNIYDILHQYHFALHTATKETGPLVLLEYMHAGLPFLTYNTGDVAEKIQGSIPEMVVHSFEVKEWVQRVEQVILHPKRMKHAVQQCTKLIADNYSETVYGDKLEKIYAFAVQRK